MEEGKWTELQVKLFMFEFLIFYTWIVLDCVPSGRNFRLFSCGTSKAGDSFLVEWNETDGLIEITYLGLRKKSQGIVQFDLTWNDFLAVGEDFQIKFWDMDNENVLTSVLAEGGLPIKIF